MKQFTRILLLAIIASFGLGVACMVAVGANPALTGSVVAWVGGVFVVLYFSLCAIAVPFSVWVLARRSLRETAGAAIPMVTLAIAVYALYGAVTGVIRYQQATEKQRSVELQRGAGVQVPRGE